MQYSPALVRALAIDGRPALRALGTVWEAERRRRSLFLPVAMGAGTATYFGLRAEPALWPLLLACLALTCIAVLARRHEAARALVLTGLAFSAGLLSPALESRRVLPPASLPRHAVIVDGVVRATDLLPQGGVRITLAQVSLNAAPPIARTIRVRLRADDQAPSDGEHVRVRALVRPPANPAYPGAWDLQRDAFFSGLAGSGFALGEATILPGSPAHLGLNAWWQGVRDRIAQRLEAGLPGPRGAIAATLMVGRSTAIPPDDRAAFTNSGLAHLLAVAGLHIGIVMGLVLGLVRNGLACWPTAALRWPLRPIAALAALASGGLYLLLTGAHLPIVRSFCMAALATLAIAIGRRALSMNGLAVAAIVILLLWPNELVGVSFQMSFAAVAALIAGYEVLRPFFARASNGTLHRRLLLHAAALALTSLLAGTASAPYAAYHFGQVQIYFVLANLLAVPITASWVMPWGLASLALMPLGAEHWALMPMGWGIGAILFIGRSVSAWPEATFPVAHIPVAGLLVTSLGIALLCLLRTRARLAGCALIAAGLASPLITRPPDLLISDDARLIATADGGRLLIAKKSGASKFTLEADQNYLATRGDPLPFPDAGRLSRDGRTILIAREAQPPDCAGADLVVASFPLRDHCPDIARVDRFSVWRNGATAVWLTPARVTLLTDRDVRGDRPWVPPPPTPRARTRRLPTLPQALAE